jgi:hypothetical protein
MALLGDLHMPIVVVVCVGEKAETSNFGTVTCSYGPLELAKLLEILPWKDNLMNIW